MAKEINVKYSHIAGGWLVIIELPNGKVVHEKFRELNDGGKWANGFCEGYTKRMEECI